jgi:hypothetical protein
LSYLCLYYLPQLKVRFGVRPPDEARLPLAVTDVTGGVMSALSGMPVKFVPVNVGAAAIVIAGVVPPEEARLPEAVTFVTHVAHEIAGVAPPDDPIGAEPVTDETLVGCGGITATALLHTPVMVALPDV